MDRALDAYIRARVLEYVFQHPTGFWSRNPVQGLADAKRRYPRLKAEWTGNYKNLIVSLRHHIHRGSGGHLSPQEQEDVLSRVLADIASDEKLTKLVDSRLAKDIREEYRHYRPFHIILCRYSRHRACDVRAKIERREQDALKHSQAMLEDSTRIDMSPDDIMIRYLANSSWVSECMWDWAREPATPRFARNRRMLITEIIMDASQTNIALAARMGISGSAVSHLKKNLGAYLKVRIRRDAEFRSKVEQFIAESPLHSDRSWLVREGIGRMR